MSYIVNITTTNITNLGTCHIRCYSLHKIFHFERKKVKYYVLSMRKMLSDNMYFRSRFNQTVLMLTNYRWRGKFTDSMMANYRHPFVSKNYRQKTWSILSKSHIVTINFVLTKYNILN